MKILTFLSDFKIPKFILAVNKRVWFVLGSIVLALIVSVIVDSCSNDAEAGVVVDPTQVDGNWIVTGLAGNGLEARFIHCSTDVDFSPTLCFQSNKDVPTPLLILTLFLATESEDNPLLASCVAEYLPPFNHATCIGPDLVFPKSLGALKRMSFDHKGSLAQFIAVEFANGCEGLINFNLPLGENGSDVEALLDIFNLTPTLGGCDD